MASRVRFRGRKGFAGLRRALAPLVLLAALSMPALPALASSSMSGGAQITWNAAAGVTLAIVTQYSAAFAQGNATPMLLPSAAGVCNGTGSEANFTLTYGALNQQAAAPVACLYKNALGISVKTNDAGGFTVNEYLDSAASAGVGFCAFPNGGGSFPLAPALSITTSSRTGNPAAGGFTGNNLTSCGAGGAVVPVAAGGTDAAGSTPGNPGTPGLEFYSNSTAVLGVMTSASPTVSGGSVVTEYGGQDIQLNLAKSAPSINNANIYLTVQLVAN
jgi:hypothetical protein